MPSHPRLRLVGPDGATRGRRSAEACVYMAFRPRPFLYAQSANDGYTDMEHTYVLHVHPATHLSPCVRTGRYSKRVHASPDGPTARAEAPPPLSLIHISEPTRRS
eukprot:2226457-Prymnesium_polylepis.1